MSSQKKAVILGSATKPSPSSKNTITISRADAELVELSRCCICFETYTKVSRVPITVPCGHTFCNVCVQRVCNAQIFHCCICRVVSVIGFENLKKNLALLQILEKMGLLAEDTGPDTSEHATSFNTNAVTSQVYSNISVEKIDLHSHFYLGLIKGYLRFQTENLDFLNTAVTDVTEATRSLDKAMTSLRKVFKELKVASNSDNLDTSLQWGLPVDDEDQYQGMTTTDLVNLYTDIHPDMYHLFHEPFTMDDVDLVNPPSQLSESDWDDDDSFTPQRFHSNSRLLPQPFRISNANPRAQSPQHRLNRNVRNNRRRIRRQNQTSNADNPPFQYFSNAFQQDDDNRSERFFERNGFNNFLFTLGNGNRFDVDDDDDRPSRSTDFRTYVPRLQRR